MEKALLGTELRPENDRSSLRQGTTRAAIASGTAQIVTRVLAVILSIATARALEPREVGLLGLAVIVTGVISMIGYYPETAAVVGKTEKHENYAVAAAVIRAAVTVFLLGAGWIAFLPLGRYLTGTQDASLLLRNLVLVLAGVPLLELLGAYPRVLMQRKLDLNSVAIATLLQPIVFVGLAVVLLWAGHGYMGVAWANVIGVAVGAVFLWLRVSRGGLVRLPGLPPIGIWRETAVGAIRVFVGGFGGFLGERLDNLLVSAAIGPASMSYYSMAWSGSRTPANVFGSTIGFVLVPTISRLQKEPSRVRRAVTESLKHSYILLSPICAILFVSAPLLVAWVLGSKWLPLVPCLRIMCFTVIAIPVLHACNALLVGAGRAHLTGIATTLHLVTLVATIPLFSRSWQLVGAAVGDLVSIAVLSTTLCVTTHIATGQIDRKIFSSLGVPLAAASLAGALSWRTGALVSASATRLAVEIGLVVIAYVFFVFLLGGRNRLNDLLEVVRGASRRAVPA